MAIFHNCDQYSSEWYALRMGIPTASCFDQIVTPAKGDLSKAHRKYAYRLVYERLLHMPTQSLDGIEHMERGKELEPAAVRQYEFGEEIETKPIGFVTTDDGRIGASPDRLLVGRPAALEIKCPLGHTHVGYLLDGRGVEYTPQIQGQLYVCELEYVDFYSYHPQMPPVLVRTHRDEAYIRKLAVALDDFCAILDEMTARAQAMGVFMVMEKRQTPMDAELREFPLNPLAAC